MSHEVAAESAEAVTSPAPINGPTKTTARVNTGVCTADSGMNRGATQKKSAAADSRSRGAMPSTVYVICHYLISGPYYVWFC